MALHLSSIILSLILGFVGPTFATEPDHKLRPYNIDHHAITISGLSSGAYMAIQMDIAFSKTLSGAASIGGGVYWCAKGDVQRAQSTCLLHPDEIDVPELLEKARSLSQENRIDRLENLKNHRLYIFAGTADTRVLPFNGEILQDFFKALVPHQQIRLDNKLAAAHGMPTLDYGHPCHEQNSPWLLNCGYDGAGETLKTLYGSLKQRREPRAENLMPFSQKEFGSAAAALFSHGWIYVPQSCRAGAPCKLHLALHGCKMNPTFIQDEFVQHAGYNAWAEANDMIILYPQADRVDFLNPYGCWDWFGYTGQDYATKSGPQMAALKAMIDRLTGN